ncbi:hypothetical protein Ga0074812_124133 [Parafrankia irregularis]|uniref:Uncharacterized protein n=1 Tax=Parafrankia irregularis TaxID=795642 RepID=A0A0S4QUW2_9ACTN|nr:MULTISPECIES: hypothetical protein [Parafrankia]MBE3203652.1 hypothetical protein [Parafrankia sp. CH37]CUU59108.1 hypothetical protein Ga0074812_124133 [Parafrankia irregularis]
MADIVVDGRRVSTEVRDQPRGFRILVDGHPVAMTLTRTETIVGNIGTSTRQTHAPCRVDWLDGAPWPDDALINVYSDSTVHVGIQQKTGYVYNTAVWHWDHLRLAFDPAYTHVDVTWDDWADVST